MSWDRRGDDDEDKDASRTHRRKEGRKAKTDRARDGLQGSKPRGGRVNAGRAQPKPRGVRTEALFKG